MVYAGRWDAGQVRCRTRGMQEGEEFSRCRMRNKMDAGEDTVDTVEENRDTEQADAGQKKH